MCNPKDPLNELTKALNDSENLSDQHQEAAQAEAQFRMDMTVANNVTSRRQPKRRKLSLTSTSYRDNDVLNVVSSTNPAVEVNNSTDDRNLFVLVSEHTQSEMCVMPEQASLRKKSSLSSIKAFMPEYMNLSESFEESLMRITEKALTSLKQDLPLKKHKTVKSASVKREARVKAVHIQSIQPVIDTTVLTKSESLQETNSETVSSAALVNDTESCEHTTTVYPMCARKEESAPDPEPLSDYEPVIEPVIELELPSVINTNRKRKAVTVSSIDMSTVALEATQSTSNDETANPAKNNINLLDTEIVGQSVDGDNEIEDERLFEQAETEFVDSESDVIPDDFKLLENGIYQSDIALKIPDGKFFATAPKRLTSLSSAPQYELTVGEVRRRILGPEAFNLSMLKALLRRGKNPYSSVVIENELHGIGLHVPRGRRNAGKVSSMSLLTEQEAAQFATDFREITDKYFPVETSAKLSISNATSNKQIVNRLKDLSSAEKILDSFSNFLKLDKSLISNKGENTLLRSEIQDSLNTYSTLTHGYGIPGLHVGLKAFRLFMNEQSKILKQSCTAHCLSK